MNIRNCGLKACLAACLTVARAGIERAGTSATLQRPVPGNIGVPNSVSVSDSAHCCRPASPTRILA